MRAQLGDVCAAIANNHDDTDGTCALFAARHPERARPCAEALLAAARAGDDFQVPPRLDPEGLAALVAVPAS